MTYMFDGKQYLAVVSEPNVIRLPLLLGRQLIGRLGHRVEATGGVLLLHAAKQVGGFAQAVGGAAGILHNKAGQGSVANFGAGILTIHLHPVSTLVNASVGTTTSQATILTKQEEYRERSFHSIYTPRIFHESMHSRRRAYQPARKGR